MGMTMKKLDVSLIGIGVLMVAVGVGVDEPGTEPRAFRFDIDQVRLR